MYRASNVHYELSERSRGLDTGGIGAIHRLAKHVGLVEELDQRVEVLKAPAGGTGERDLFGDGWSIVSRVTLCDQPFPPTPPSSAAGRRP